MDATEKIDVGSTNSRRVYSMSLHVTLALSALARSHARPHPWIRDVSGQHDATEQIAADRSPIFQRKDTDRICGRVTRCWISSFVTAGLWLRSGYRVVALVKQKGNVLA